MATTQKGVGANESLWAEESYGQIWDSERSLWLKSRDCFEVTKTGERRLGLKLLPQSEVEEEVGVGTVATGVDCRWNVVLVRRRLQCPPVFGSF